MQHVALQLLGIVHQDTNLVGLLGDLDAQRILDGLGRGQRVRDRANPADAADDRLDVFIAAAPHHRLEEPRRFRNLPLDLLDLAVGGIDHDVAMSLDTRHMVYVYIHCLSHRSSAPVCFQREPFWS